MKKNLFTMLCATFIYATTFSQTATDFTANDCSSASHNLFTELNAGKIIVLVWVMPCGVCVGPALTTYNVVQSFQSAHPNTVYMYLCDDVANTACTSLNSWKTSNSLTNAITFSDAAISMSSYGSSGMPKIVVLGTTNHTVFYNANNTVDATALQNAINSAITSTGIEEQNNSASSISVFPNPSSGSAEIKFTLAKSSNVILDLFNLQGKKVKNIFTGNLSSGENKIKLSYSGIDAGMYLVQMSVGDKNKFVNVVVTH